MKKKRIKIKLTAWILAIVMLCSTAGAAVYYVRASSYDPPAVVLLESMLNGDRQWVIETIVEDNRTNNPYVLNPNEMSLMAKALSQYENKNDPDYKALFSLLVNVLTKYYYTGLWATDLGDNELVAWAEEHPGEMMLLFGGTGVAPLVLLVGQIKNLAETEQFDNILFSVFQDTYKSSWGESVNEQEMILQQLNEISDTMSNVSDMTGYWEKLYGTQEAEGKTEEFWEFMEKVAVPLQGSGSKFLEAFNSLGAGEQAATMVALTMASSQCAYNWLKSESKKSNDESVKTELKKYVAGSDASKFLEQVSDGFEWTSTLISQYSFLHSVYNQKELFQETVNRMASQASADGQKNMSRILSNYATMMDTAYSSDKLQLVTILRTLSSMSEINSNANISTIYDKTVKFAKDCGYKQVPFSSISSVFDVGMVVIDQCTGLKNTCLKTYELKYLRDIINETKKVYENDLLTYTGDPTEENANKVLMDLLMLQRLRLKGEKIAYNMTKGQLNSWIGRLLTGYNTGNWGKNLTSDTELAEAWTEHYQRSVDALIGATICPFANDSFQVAQGEELFILYDSEKNTYRARYTKAGKDITLYEMQYRVMNGIKVNGGDVTITGVSVPFVVATGTSKIAFDRTAKVGEITQSGTGTLELYNGQSSENYTLEVPFSMDLQKATVKLNGNTIDTPKLTLTNGILLENGNLVTDELTLNRATVTGGTITCPGNVSTNNTSGSSCSSLILNGNKKQTVTGTFTAGDLVLDNSDNKGITVNGTININGTLTDPKNIVKNGLTLVSGGDIAGDRVASDIIFKGGNVTKPIYYKRNVTVAGGGTINGGTINGFLELESGTLTNNGAELKLNRGIHANGGSFVANADVSVYEEIVVRNTVFAGEAVINLDHSGTVSVNNSSFNNEVYLKNNEILGKNNSFEKLIICGTVKQSVAMSATVAELVAANESLLGIELLDNLEVTRAFTASNQRIKNGSNLVITGTAEINVDGTKSDVSLQNWRGTFKEKFNGDIYLTGNNEIMLENIVKGGISQLSGATKIANTETTIGMLEQKTGSNLTIDENCNIKMTEGFYIGGTVRNTGEIQAGKESIVDGTIVNQGVVTLEDDCIINGTISDKGTVISHRDLTFASNNTFGELKTEGNTLQVITGKKVYVNNYANLNKSDAGIQIDALIFVAENYLNDGIIRGNKPIVTKGYTYAGDTTLNNWSVEADSTVNGNLTVSGALTLAEGMNLTVNGSLTSTGTITVNKEATLIIDGHLLSTSNWIVIEEGGEVIIRGAYIGKTVNMQLNGICSVWSDCMLTSGSITGTGKFLIYSDLSNSATINELECLEIAGKTPQKISGTAMHVNHVVVDNSSAQGIEISTTIYYKDSVNVTEQCVVDEAYLVEETE